MFRMQVYSFSFCNSSFTLRQAGAPSWARVEKKQWLEMYGLMDQMTDLMDSRLDGGTVGSCPGMEAVPVEVRKQTTKRLQPLHATTSKKTALNILIIIL